MLLLACHAPAESELAAPELAPAPDPHALLATTQSPATLRCSSGDDTHERTLTDQGSLHGLLADTTYSCTLSNDQNTSPPAQYHTPPLPTDLPLPTLSQSGTTDWHLIQLEVSELQNDQPEILAQYLMILDTQGQPRWQWNGAGGGDLDVTWMDNGQILMGGNEGPQYVPPTLIDLDGNTLWQVPNELPWEDRLIGEWNHDAGLSHDRQHVLAIARDLNGKEGEFSLVSIRLDSGEVDWIWDSERDGAPTLALDGSDPYHANALWDDETRVYVSLRHSSHILAIDKASKTIDWVLGVRGDFALQDPEGNPLDDLQWFYVQHDAKVVGDWVSLFDNGIASEGSRVMGLRLDESARTATLEQNWGTTESNGSPWYMPMWGGVDPTPSGGVSVAAGRLYWAAPQSPPARLFELDAENNVVWRIDWTDPRVALYRSDRLEAF